MLERYHGHMGGHPSSMQAPPARSRSHPVPRPRSKINHPAFKPPTRSRPPVRGADADM